jgi:3',5'-cyclic-nucleotide phosphodiesterase
MELTTLPARHGIPGCGFRVEHDGVALAFSGDTADCPEFWEAVKEDRLLKAVIVECSYTASMQAMASLSMHLDSDTLLPRLSALPNSVTPVIVHRKPGLESQIAAELTAGLTGKALLFPQASEELIFAA